MQYGARCLNEGGFHAIPKLTFPGGAMVRVLVRSLKRGVGCLVVCLALLGWAGGTEAPKSGALCCRLEPRTKTRSVALHTRTGMPTDAPGPSIALHSRPCATKTNTNTRARARAQWRIGTWW